MINNLRLGEKQMILEASRSTSKSHNRSYLQTRGLVILTLMPMRAVLSAPRRTLVFTADFFATRHKARELIPVVQSMATSESSRTRPLPFLSTV